MWTDLFWVCGGGVLTAALVAVLAYWTRQERLERREQSRRHSHETGAQDDPTTPNE